jgi:homoserine kinase type II
MVKRLQQVLARYDLGKLRVARRVERGFVNDNWAVETARGRFFLKRRLLRRRGIELVRAQHALVQWLHQAGFPVPALVPTVDGETLLVLDDEWYEVQEFIAGVPYDPARPAHFREAALTLGRYHACVRSFAPGAFRSLGRLHSPVILSVRLASLLRAWDLERDPDLAPMARRLQDHAADLAARFREHGPLPFLVIHGDYYADNLLFEGDRVVGVVDYDKARWQPRVVELAEALIYFASPRPGYLRHLVYPGVLEWEALGQFARIYAEVIELERAETRALPDYVRCIWLSVSIQRLLERGSRLSEASDAAGELLELADWAADNAAEMVAAVRGPMEGRS